VTNSAKSGVAQYVRPLRESDIERYLVKRVKALGGEVRKVKWIGRRGAPDRLVMMPRRWRKERPLRNGDVPMVQERSFWVELKAPGKKPTSQQRREHLRMAFMGQHVEVIDSIEGVDALLA
jgi:hypothetical protein